MAQMETADQHSGYEFSWSPYRLIPLSGSANYHNFHHSHNVGNYTSLFTIWDTLCGTNSHYFKFQAAKERKQAAASIQKEKENLNGKSHTNSDTQSVKKLE